MERYKGIKFNVRFIDRTIPNFSQQKDLMRWGRKLSELGCIPIYSDPTDYTRICSAGNLSVRNDDDLIITAAGSNLSKLRENDFVEVIDVDIEATLITVKGMHEPSSETMLHNEIYKKRDDVNVIFHGHNSMILQNADALGLRSTKQHYPYGSVELVRSVLDILDKRNGFFIMKEHGFISLGKTCHEAGHLIINVLKNIK